MCKDYAPRSRDFGNARVLHHLELYQQAIDSLTKAVLLDSSNSQFYRLRAECREKVGDVLRAAGDRMRAENMEKDAQSARTPAEPAQTENNTAPATGDSKKQVTNNK